MTEEQSIRYKVVLNDEEQYSIWPEHRENPAGWYDEGTSGTREECLEHIGEIWTDIRPLSVRQDLERAEEVGEPDPEPDPVEEGPSLVDRLTAGDQPVEVRVRPEPTPQGLRECLDRGYVHICFTETRGGTEVGVELDADASDWTAADFEAGTGEVRLTGTLSLDDQDLHCHARIALDTLSGEGRMERALPAGASS